MSTVNGRIGLYFCVGLLLGLVVSFIFTSYSSISSTHSRYASWAEKELIRLYQEQNQTETSTSTGEHQHHDLSHDELDKLSGPTKPYEFHDEHMHHDDTSLADELEKRVRVLCWIMTGPQNLQKKAQHVRATWGNRCNVLLFMSSENNTEFPTIGLNIAEGREHLTAKTMRAFKYVYDNHYNEADWFMKADDDTYVIVENLRYMLSDKNTSDPVYFGHHFKVIVKQGYFSGGAGYVLSKEALRRFALHGYGNKETCRADGGAEDVEIGSCMEKLGVKVGDSRDALGRSRFHCFNPETHMFGGYPDWYLSYDKYGAKKGTGNISDYAVSFHYVEPNKMYTLEFYTYHLRPYGITQGKQEL